MWYHALAQTSNRCKVAPNRTVQPSSKARNKKTKQIRRHEFVKKKPCMKTRENRRCSENRTKTVERLKNRATRQRYHESNPKATKQRNSENSKTTSIMRGKQEIKPPWFFDSSRFVSLLPKYPKQHFFHRMRKKRKPLACDSCNRTKI